MRYRLNVACTAVTALIACVVTPLGGQATRDQSRLLLGVSFGYIGGSSLWQVNNQPISAGAGRQDFFDLNRRLRSNITVIGQGTFFPSDHIGLSGEVSYLGLGTSDACQFVPSANDGFNEIACNMINGDERSASAVALSGGVVLRPFSRSAYQPYVRAMAGVALVPRSTIPLTANVLGINEESLLQVYLEGGDRDAKPTGVLAFGLSTAPSAGYQFRIEARATAVQLLVVSGPTTSENQSPSTRSVTKVLPSIVVGLDVVLEKRRGRRY